MKKSWKPLAVLFVLFAFALFAIACKKEPLDPELELTRTAYELEIGATTDIGYTIKNEKDGLTVLFASEDDEVATVDSAGKITAIAEGETVITVVIDGYPETEKEIAVSILGFPLTLTGPNSVNVGETITLTATDRNRPDNTVLWESENQQIASVDENGTVTGIAPGTVTIKIYSKVTTDTLEKEITVVQPEPVAVEVSVRGNPRIIVLSEIRLKHKVSPAGANQNVTWRSSDENIATVDQEGRVYCLHSGTVDIIAVADGGVEGSITLNIEVDPIEIIKSFHVANPIARYVTTYGNSEKSELVYGSVSRYFPGPLNLREQIIDITPTIDGAPNPYIGQVATPAMIQAAEMKTVRSGILKPEIKSIIYHDTGNNDIGTNAANHAAFMVGPYNNLVRSWHYTVDDEEVIQHLPDNEVGWQGDTYAAYTTTIGIETCVDQNSDLYTTWHRTAKLMATLLVKYDLKVSDIKQHYDFSQKNCPQTLRRNNLYANAISLVEAEYLALTELSGYTITFTSSNTEYVDNYGRIVKLLDQPIRVGYMVMVSDGKGYNESIFLYSDLPAKP